MTIRVVANRYELESEIGRGGMAVVYQARDLRLNRLVAFKLLHPYLATQAESAARFTRESEAIAKLHHPNIVEIFDAGNDEETGSHFLVMELIGGTTLSAFISQHPTRIPEVAVAMLCCLCDAVEHAHKAGIIHRDIKPENVMFASDGQLKLMDFGIARILDADRMTASGSLIGSPAHMPPEIIEGQSYTFSCDIFSLGTVLYYALTQALPFRGATPMAVFKAILDGNYQSPGRICQTVTKKLDTVVAKCLKIVPSERYQTIHELRTDLIEILKAVNMEDYTAIVKQYFIDPDKFYEERLPAVKSCIQASAQLAVREHRLPIALECLNRILAYDPDDVHAAAMLRHLRTGSAIKKRLSFGLVAIALLGFLFIIWKFWSPSPSEIPLHARDTAADKQIELPADTETENKVADQPELRPAVEMVMPQNRDIPLHNVANNTSPVTDWSEIQTRLGILLNQDELLKSETAENNNTETTDINDPERPESQENIQVALNKPVKPKSRENSRNPSLRTPKKTIVQSPDTKPATEQEAQPKSEVKHQTPTETADTKQPVSESTSSLPTASALVKVIQPVFPPDAYAVINGRRYAANSSGDIELLLAPGNYRMTLTCNRRCVKQTINFKISADAQNTTREIVSLEWADAALNLTGPSGKNLYYVARRLDDRNQRVYHLVPRTPNAINGFNTFGRPIQLEVYAIPTANTLKSYDTVALEHAKYASTRVSLSPGDTKSIEF